MTKTKIFMSLGSLVLACSAFLAAKPAKKFSTFQTAHAKTGAFTGVVVVGPSNTFFTTTQDANNITLQLTTVNGNARETLYDDASGSNTAFIYVP